MKDYIQELSDLTNTDPGMVQSMLNSSALSPGHTCSCPPPAMMTGNMMYPSYTMESSAAADISLTTSSPVQQSGDTSTVTHTTLPPVQLPGPKPGTTDTVAQVSSLPASVPDPVNRNGVFTCGGSSSGMTTNFVNPSYPNTDSDTGQCKFYLVLNSNVCQVRVDFVDTELLSPERGDCNDQYLIVRDTFSLQISSVHCLRTF